LSEGGLLVAVSEMLFGGVGCGIYGMVVFVLMILALVLFLWVYL